MRPTGRRLVIDIAGRGTVSHALPDDPDTECRIVARLAPHIPTEATWRVEQ